MRRRLACLVAAVVLALVPRDASAQAGATGDAQPRTSETSPFADNDFPSLLRNLKVRSNELLEASLSVEDKGAKVTFAPFLYSLVNYRPAFSETRLTISQSNGVTTMGVGATYDGAAPRSSLGAKLWKKGAPTGRPAADYVLTLRKAAADLQKELEPKQQKLKEAIQIENDAERDAIIMKLAAEIGDLKARATALLAEGERALAVDTQEETKRIATFYRQLLEASIPVVNGSFTTSLFGNLGGTRQDANNNGRADTAEKVKSRAIAVSVDVPFRTYIAKQDKNGKTVGPSWRWLQLSGIVTSEWQRGSQEEDTPFARLFGFGVTGGGIVKILNRDFESTPDYKDSFFIPAISAGASYERKRCTSDDKALCPDSIETQSTFTPFVDVRITKAAQFRFGVPLKFTHKVAGDKAKDMGLVGVYAIQLGAPK
jgi:hypothetical protein